MSEQDSNPQPPARDGAHGADHGADWFDDPELRAWAQDVLDDLVPKLRASSVALMLAPRGETDLKFAVELGLSIMLDKPILAVVSPGAKVPSRLARVADEIVEVDLDRKDWSDDERERLSAALRRLGVAR